MSRGYITQPATTLNLVVMPATNPLPANPIGAFIDAQMTITATATANIVRLTAMLDEYPADAPMLRASIARNQKAIREANDLTAELIAYS